MRDLVSIIMPTYDSGDFVLKSIQSIQAQTYPDWELLITDDCSSDHTVELIEKVITGDPRIKLFQFKQNRGAGAARNHSIEQASGRYIAFCDSDDLWKPEKLKKQLRFMKEHDQVFCYSSYEKIDGEGHSLAPVTCLPQLTYRVMLRNNYVACLTAIYDTEKLGKQFLPTIRKRQDWALWLNIFKLCGKVKGIPEPLAIYRDRSGSISSNKVEMLKYTWAIYHDVEKFGVIRSFLYVVRYVWYYLLKKATGK